MAMWTPLPLRALWVLLVGLVLGGGLLASPISASISDATWESHASLDAALPGAAAGGAAASSLFPHVISSDDLAPSDDEWDDPNSIKHIMQATGQSTGGNSVTDFVLNVESYNVSQCIPAPTLLTPPIAFLNANSTTGSVNVTVSLTGVANLNGGVLGTLTLQSQGAAISLAPGSTGVNQASPINFVATSITAANLALASLTYTPAQGLQDVTNEVAIQVSAFLVATPTVTAFSAYTVSFAEAPAYTPLVIVPIDYQSFSNLTAPGNVTIHIPAIQVVDLANPNDELAVVISQLNGYVSISNTSNLIFQDNPYINTINFAGHLADVNNALSTLVWTSACPSLNGCTSTAYAGFTVYVRDFANNTECPTIAILDCTLDVSPNGLSIIEAALPAPIATPVTIGNSTAWNITWVTLQSLGWQSYGMSSDPTAYALLISSNPSTQGFAQVYYGLGTSFLLTNLSAGTTYTVEVEIYSVAGLSVCPGYISAQTGRSVCAPNPTSFTTGGVRPGSAYATLLGSTSSSLSLTTSPPAGVVDSLLVTVFQGNATTGLTPLTTPFVVIPVEVAGGAVVEVVTGLSPFTPYTIVVQARNSAGLGPATSITAWTLLQGPAIIGFVASDPTNLHTAVQSGDLITLTFDMDTNQPAVDSKAAIDALLSFSSPIAADYSGAWTSANTLRINLTSVTTQSPTVGVEVVKVIGNLRSADLVSDVSTSSAMLVGNWGTFGLSAYFTLPSAAVSLQENAEAYLGVTTNFPASLLADPTVYLLTVQILSPIMAGASLSGGAVWSSSGVLISTNGTASALQSVLSSVLYTAPPGYFGPASFQYQLLTSTSSTLVAELVQVVSISHSNHLPILIAPESVTLPLEQWTSIPSISVSDVDVALGSLKDSMTLIVAASEGGALSWSGSASSGVVYAPSFNGSSPIFQLTGPMLVINLALKSLQAKFEYGRVVPGAALQPFLLLSVNDFGNGGQPAITNAQRVPVELSCPIDQSLVLATAVNTAQLSSTGNELLLTLSLPVSPSVLSSPFFDCSTVFTASTVTLFGASPACHWVSNAQLQVELGLGATVSPSTPLQVVANAFARCGGVATASAAASVAVLAPSSAAMSSVFISGPSMASLCEDLTLTAVTFASSSHALSYSWTLPSAFLLVDGAASIDLHSPSVTVPAALFSSFTSQPTYTFTLTVTDYLGLSHSAAFDVEMDHTAKPLIQPLTPTTLSVRVEDELDLHAAVSLPSCSAAPAAALPASTSPAVTFNWAVTPSLSGVSLGSAASLHLPSSVLSYSANLQHAYTFTLTAQMADNANLLSIQQFTVVVVPSALQARIAGGRLLTIAPSSALIVDASTSYDADAVTAKSNSFTSASYSYQWSCQAVAPSGADSTSACYGTDGALLAMPNSPLLNFSAGLLSTNTYTFTLLYTHIPTGRTSTVSQTVQVTDPYVTVVDLSLDAAPFVINAGDKLALSAHASQPAAFTWSISGSGLVHSALALPTAVNASAMSALVLNAAQSAAFFETGTTYAIQSTARSAGGELSTATVAVYVNAPPTCSQPLSVSAQSSPAVGVALSTGYVLSIPSSSCWDVDAEQADALLYQFFRRDADSGLYYWLTAPSPVPATSELVLPSGTSVQVGVRVLDRLGGYSEYSTTLTVAAPASSALSASALLSSYNAQTATALQAGDAVSIAATIASVLSTTSSTAALSPSDLSSLKDALLTDLLTFASALPDDYITPVLALLVSDASSTSVSAAKYALTFVAALSAGDSMAASVNQLHSVIATLDGVVARIGAGQGASGTGARRRLLQGSSQALDAATLNALNTELFASLNSLAVDISTQLLSVEGDELPISANLLTGVVQRGLIGGSPFTVSVSGSTLTVPSTSALSSVAPVGSAFDVAVIRTPSASFEYVAQVGQVSEVYFVGAYAAAAYSSPLAPHTSTSSLVSALSASTYANSTVTFDVAYNSSEAGSCLNSASAVTGLVCSLECRQWNGTAFSTASISTDFLALNAAQATARCVLSQPGIVALFQASESSAVLAASTGSSSTASSADQSAAVRASVTFPSPFTIVNMKDFKQGLVQDLASVTGQPSARFYVEQVTTNSQNGLTTVIIDIWVPTDASQAGSQSVYLQLAALSTTAVLDTTYLRYADLSSWLEQCSDLVFRAVCASSASSSSSWMLPLIISASVAGLLLLCALTALAVRRFYSAPAKDDKALSDFTLPTAGGVAKQYIYSPPTAGKELDAEMSKHDEVSDVTIVAGNSGIDPHTASSLQGGAGDEEISEPVIVESEAEAAELAQRSDLHSGQSKSAASASLPADLDEEEKELSMTRGSVSGQSRHFYYVDDSVKGSRTEVSTTSSSLSSRSSDTAEAQSTTGRTPRASVSQAVAAPQSKSHFRVSAGPASDEARDRSASASVSSRSATPSAAGRSTTGAHFRYSDNEAAAEASTSRTPSLPHLPHSPSHSASAVSHADGAAFHTFTQLDLDSAQTQQTQQPAAAGERKKAIKVIRPGQQTQPQQH